MRRSVEARKWVRILARVRAKRSARLSFARWLLPILPSMMLAFPACCQDSGSAERESYGNGSEITVTVHDASGEPIATPAMVKLYRDGNVLSRQGATSQGSAVLVVYNVGEFSVSVEAPGYESAEKEVSVRVTGRTQVDIYLRPISAAGSAAGVPGRPLLAPKAKEALEKGLQALNENKLKAAEKYVGEAMRLASGNPDVLYVQGVLSLREGRWAQAQNVLEKATQMEPNHARALAALGMALCDEGKFDEAVAPLEKSLELDATGTWETRWALAKADYQEARYEQALKMSEAALAASNGKAPEIGLLVAQSLTAVGRYEDAAEVLREFMKEHGDRREAGTARRWLERLTVSGKIRTN